MKKSLIALAAASVVAAVMDPKRARTHDVAFPYRMGAGFPGDVNRTHPASILPGKQDVTTPVRRTGEPALIDTTHSSYRGLTAADASDSTAIVINAILVREYPVQAATAAGNFGQQALTDATAAPPANAVTSYLESGFIMAKYHGATAPTKNGAVYGFCSADEAGHVLGGFETAAIAGKTVPISNARWRGAADANGIAEIEIFAHA